MTIMLKELASVKLMKFTLQINLIFSQTFKKSKIKDMQSKNKARSNFIATKCRSYVFFLTSGFKRCLGLISASKAPSIFNANIANCKIITAISFKFELITL